MATTPGTYKDLGDGLYAVHTPLGRAVIRTDEATLQAAGRTPEPDDTENFNAAYDAAYEVAQGGQPGPDDSAGFAQDFQREMENPTPDRPLETPVYDRNNIKDPGRLSEAFGGAEAKGDKWSKNPDGTFTRTGPDGSKWVTDLPPQDAPRDIRQQGVANVEAKEAAERERLRQGLAKQPVRFAPAARPGASAAPAAPVETPGDKGPLVDPTAGGAAAGQPSGEGGDPLSPTVQQVMAEARRGGGGGYSPGGMRLAERSIKGSPDAYGAIARQMGQKPDWSAARAANVPVMRGNLAQANEMEGWAQEQDADLAAEEKHRREVIDPEIQRVRNEAMRAWQAAAKVDKPDADRLWKNKSTLGKLIASVWMVFSRIAAAKTGVSFYDQYWESAKAKDLDAQKEEYQRAIDQGKAADNEYARLVKFHGTPAQAEKDWNIRADIAYNAHLKALALKSQNPKIIAWQAQREAEVEAQLRAEQAKLLKDAAPTVEEKWKYQAPSGGGSPSTLKVLRAGAEATKLEDEILRRTKGKGSTADQRGREYNQKIQIHNLPGGVTGFAPPEDASKIRVMQAQKAALDDGVKRVSALRAEMKAGKLSPMEYYSRLQSLNAQMGVSFKDKTGLGAWDNGVVNLWSRITGLPAGKERKATNLYGALPTPGELVGIIQSKGRLDEFQKQSDSLFQETLRYRVTRDPEGSVPFYTQTPE